MRQGSVDTDPLLVSKQGADIAPAAATEHAAASPNISEPTSIAKAVVTQGAATKEQAATTQEPAVAPATPLETIIIFTMIFISRLEVSVLHLAIPPVAKEFSISMETAAWISMGSNFAGVMSGPAAGKWADMYGPALTWRRGVFILVVSTWMTGFAPNFFTLMVARFLCGISQSLVFAPGLPMLAKGMHPDFRGVVASQIKVMDTLGAGIGIMAGGLFMEFLSWRWIFLLPAPVMTLLYVLSFWVVIVPPTKVDDKSWQKFLQFDWAGTVIFSAASFLFLFSVNRGNDMGWTSPWVIGMGLASVLLAQLLAWVEWHCKNPVIGLGVYSGIHRALSLTTVLCSALCFLTAMLIWPTFLQFALEMPAGTVGELLSVRPFAAAVQSTIVTGLLKKKSVSKLWLTRVGAILMCLATSALQIVSTMSPGLWFYTAVVIQLFVQSAGHFMVILPAHAMCLALVPNDQLGNANQLRQVAGNFLGLLGQAVHLSVIRLTGNESQVDSYAPCWIILSVNAMITVVLSFAIPADIETDTDGLRAMLNADLKLVPPKAEKCVPEFGIKDQKDVDDHANKDAKLEAEGISDAAPLGVNERGAKEGDSEVPSK